MKINQSKEDELKEISEMAKNLETALERLGDEINGDFVGLTAEPLLIMSPRSGDAIELSISDIADYQPLKEAWLKL